MKQFKKIYIEITNKCNLNCAFCSEDNLKKREMTLDEFEMILQKIDGYTDYIYLHVKGEPLIHSKFSEILDLCEKYDKKVNITTNGVLLKHRLEDLKRVRQINLSLQSITEISLLKDIFEVVDVLKNTTYISYRLWVRTGLEKEIIRSLQSKYSDFKELKNQSLDKNVFINFEKEFLWPSIKNGVCREKGTCYGTRTHIAILVDGTVVPCCLDSFGVIDLGNIYEDSLENIVESERFYKIKSGFENNILEEELCKRCGFI